DAVTSAKIVNDAVTPLKIDAALAGTGLTRSAAGVLSVDGTGITGDGDITSSDLTVSGDADALLGDVTLEIAAGAVGTTELADDAVTSAKILDGTIASGDIADDAVTPLKIDAAIAGTGIARSAAGVLSVDGTGITGDGDITSSDLTVGGDADALLGDVTLEIAAGAVGTTELADDAVTSAKILDGTIASGDIASTGNDLVLTTGATGTVEWIGKSTLVPATTVSNTSSVNTLTTTVDGVTGTGVNIVNTNTLTLNGSDELVSTVNGVASTGLDISSLNTNIYSDDGALAANRAVTQGSFDLNFDANTLVVSGDDDRVGIGTDSPDAKLDVEGGQVRFTDYADAVTQPYEDSSANYLLATDAEGDVVQVNSVKASRVFYPPSIAIDASSPDASVRTLNLYSQYVAQFGSPAVSSTGASGIPIYDADELEYHVTLYDTSVLTITGISALGEMTYTVDNSPADYNSLINVVFVVK
uniref:hypothetical protein n=1 Tax=uncultured Croceitalea sp. TaxID=1798908 RepID=UPI0033069011